MEKYEYKILELDCANCANKIQEELNKNPKLKNVCVNFAKQRLSYETDSVSKEEVEQEIQRLEPEVKLVELSNKKDKTEEKNKSKILLHIIRLVMGLLIAILGIYANIPDTAKIILVILGYIILLYRTAKNAIKLLFKSKTINENLLITISCIGAYIVGKHMEGLMVITLYEIGKILEEKAINKTRKSISELMDIKPEYANLKKGTQVEKVNPEEVNIGDVVVIKQGEKVPLDGKIVKGNAILNTASLTGEARPVDVKIGANVLSGSIVEKGLLEIEVTEKYENSTVNKILEFV